MKIALIADMHGNWPATEAVAADLARRGIDTVYCLGDMIGKGPNSIRVMDWACARCSLMLMGNWEQSILEINKAAAQFFLRQIGPERAAVLRALPFEHRFMMSGRRIRLLHGRPLTDGVLFPEDHEAAKPLFNRDGEVFDMVIYADAHRQGLSQIDKTGTLLNTGSVGNSLGGVTKACYLILDGELGDTPAPLDILFVALEYDREQAVRDAQGLPDLPKQAEYIREIRTGLYARQ